MFVSVQRKETLASLSVLSFSRRNVFIVLSQLKASQPQQEEEEEEEEEEEVFHSPQNALTNTTCHQSLLSRPCHRSVWDMSRM